MIIDNFKVRTSGIVKFSWFGKRKLIELVGVFFKEKCDNVIKIN